MIIIKKFDYADLKGGEKKKAETKNGRLLLKEAVFREFGVNSDAFTIAIGDYGKPFFPEKEEIFFNISHSGEYVAAAAEKYPVGIDIQTVRKVREGMIDKVCDYNEKEFVLGSSDREKSFITLWTLKESYIKAIGKGMSFPMNRINFRLDGCGGEFEGRISNQSGYYYVKDYGEFVLAVCWLGYFDEIKFSIIKALSAT